MGVYIEVQPLIVQQRIEEMNRLNANLPQPPTEPVPNIEPVLENSTASSVSTETTSSEL
jgi:hypothetical protein